VNHQIIEVFQARWWGSRKTNNQIQTKINMILVVQALRQFVRRQLVTFITLALILCSVFGGLYLSGRAGAATNSTINFQARLMNGAGSLAPDGDYNIEFKIYDTASSGGTDQGVCGGNCQWLETRTGASKVRVANGYLTVNLGSITAFASTIKWDQELWITMNIGGTASPSWDGEMSPRLKLTAVPYALRASQLAAMPGGNGVSLQFASSFGQATTITLPDPLGASATVCYQNSATCGFAVGAASDFIQNQNATDQAANFRISGTARANTALQAPLLDTATATVLALGTTNATAINLNQNTTIASGKILTVNGTALVQPATDSSSAFNVRSAGGNNVFTVDSGSGRVGIALTGSNVPTLASFGLQINGALRLSGGASQADDYITPNGGTVKSAINIVNYDPGGFGQLVAIGLPSSADSTSRALTLLDARSGSHQPTLAVISPNQNEIGGFSWDGSNAAFLVKSSASGSIGLNVAGTTRLSATTSGVDVSGTLSASSTITVGALGSPDTATYVCRNAANQIAACNTAGNGVAFTQGGNDFNATAVLGTTDADNLQFQTNGVLRSTFDTGNNLYLGNGVTAAAPNNFSIRGTGSSTTAVAGGALTIQGGSATVGSANGGNVTITGGAGVGTGVRGLVVIDTPTFTTATVQSCGTNCTITQANVDSSGAVIINATAASLSVSLPDPTIITAGRIVYVTAANGSSDFTLSVNGGGTGNQIAMRQNTTATMVWNGSDWTAAGASSSTTLQAAYDNTLSSAGGAEIVLNNTATSDGLTVRNSASSPIIGAILEAQTSIGSNLFSVNNNATEYASNGGAETAGASSSTFPSNTWSAAPAGGTVSRNTTATNNATGQASVSVVTGATAGHGARDRLSAALTANLQYTVSFTVKGATSFTTLNTIYSRDGTDVSTTACVTGSTVTTAIWTRISCTFTAPASGITGSNEIFIRQSDATARTFYIDNLSVTVNASSNHAADGSVDASLGSNWTQFDADGGAGTTTLTRETTIIYDTSGSVSDATTAHANLGMRNNLAITPQTSTQYLVTFYARSSNTFNDIRVGFLPSGGNSAPAAAQLCTDYNTQSVSTTGWTKITCIITTPSSGITDPDLVIYQPSATARTFYVDALSTTLNTNTASNVQIGGGNKGGPATLLTLDRSAGPPIADNNDAYLGSMYYDTTSGRIQCYEADGWGACGAAPDNIVNLNPEYAGAVLNGSGVGTMAADFCSNDTALQVNTTLCSTGQAKNYYRWTSPQATEQAYSIYVTYQLPATFKNFSSDDTVQLVARTDSTSNAAVTYEMFKSDGSTVTKCGTGETTVVTSANAWQSVGINGNESTSCNFSSSSAGNFVIFKINLKARSNANAYVSTLSFTTTGR
jgi:Carbohydrate binding domain